MFLPMRAVETTILLLKKNPLKDNTRLKCFDVHEKPKRMNHLWRRREDQGRGKGNPMWLRGCQVIRVQQKEISDQIRETTDRSCSRSPSCRPCRGQCPGHWGLLSELPLWTASYSPNLTDPLENESDRERTRLKRRSGTKRTFRPLTLNDKGTEHSD